jgi:hypothetical protein
MEQVNSVKKILVERVNVQTEKEDPPAAIFINSSQRHPIE